MSAILEQLKKDYKLLLGGMGLGPRPTNFIGLDMGSRYFRAARIKKTGDEFSVQDTLVGKIEELKDFPGKMRVKDEEELCVNFNLEGIVIRRISMPVMPYDEIESALKWEFKEQAGFDGDKLKIKFSIIGEKDAGNGARKMELMAFAYQEADIEPKVRHLKEIGLNVRNVMPLDFALARYVDTLKITPHGEKAAIVDIGSAKTIISIVENSRVCFTREIAMGGYSITEAMTGVVVSEKGRLELSRQDAETMKREQGIPSDIKILSLIRPVLERLVSQIKGSLEYYEQHFHEQSIRKIALAGNGSRLKGLKEYIVRETGMEVLAILPEEAGAIGLALNRDFGLNMLPERYISEDKKALKRFSMTVVIFTVLFILLFSYALLCIQAVNLKKGVEIQRQHWDNLSEIKLLKDKIAAYSFIINTVYSNNINAGMIMKEISNMILPDMALERFLIDNKEPNIKISGNVPSQGLLTEFMSKLESNPLFQSVKLSFSEKNKVFGQDAVSFEITCNMRKK